MYPSLYNPADAFRSYEPRITEFIAEGLALRRFIPTLMVRNGIICVDCQEDFVSPDGALSVPGAQEDIMRIVEMIYTNLENIAHIYVFLDTHQDMHVFFSNWWEYVSCQGTEIGQPKPFTQIIPERGGGRAQDERGNILVPVRDADWTLQHYLPNLTEPLTIWTNHCRIGTKGHALSAVLREALAFWSAVTGRSVTYVHKGLSPFVEHYGIFAAEIAYPGDPATFLNVPLLEEMKADNDYLFFVGQAKSHCVLKSEWQALRYYPPSFARRLRHIDDASSSVPHPSDLYEVCAEEQLTEMEKLGLRRIRSSDPLPSKQLFNSLLFS